jgi:glycogen(starch) synthase
MLERSMQLGRSAAYDVVHAHDWETAWAAAATKNLFELPLVSTLHGVEPLDGEESRLISQAEWWLTYEARRTIVPTDELRTQIEGAFELPVDKQAVIPGDVPAVEQAARTAAVYGEAIEDDRERRSRGEVRPPLRVILGRSQKT